MSPTRLICITHHLKEMGVFSTEIKMGENMIALKIEDMKQFTASLFLGEVFDSFLLKEAEIVTFNMFTIDGRVRHGYYSEEELEESPDRGIFRLVCSETFLLFFD